MNNKIRLSTAIRKGIQHFPEQTKEIYFRSDWNPMGACALGCAIFTVYGSPDGYMIDDLVADFPELYQEEYHIKPKSFPPSNQTDHLKDVIVTLNDDIGWTREQIADWLESEGL